MIFISETVEFGGHEIASTNLAKFFFEKNNIEILFYVNQHNISFKKFLNANNIKYKTTNATKLYPLFNFFNPLYHLKLINILRYSEQDIVLVNGNMDFNLLSIIYSKYFKINFFVYLPFVPSYSKLSNNKILGFIRDFFHLFFYKLIDRFILINYTDIKLLKSKNKFVRRPLVFENLVSSSDLKWNKKTASKIYNIAVPGRLVNKQKNQKLAIKILKKLVYRHHNIKMCFYGAGPDLKKLERFSKKYKLNHLIKFEGHISNLPKHVINKSDLVLFTTKYEGVPLTLLELINSGIPIVASNIPIHQHFLNDCDIFNNIEHAVEIISKYIIGEKTFFPKIKNSIKLSTEKNINNINVYEKDGYCFR